MNEQLRETKVLKSIADDVARGLDWKAIARNIDAKYRIKAGAATIKKVYEGFMDKGFQASDKIQKEVEDHVLNISEQLKKINTIANRLIDEYYKLEQEEPNAKTLFAVLNLMQQIQNQLVFQEKLLERIAQTSTKTQINNVYLTKVIVQNIKNLEESGFIKILKKLPIGEEEEEKMEEIET